MFSVEFAGGVEGVFLVSYGEVAVSVLLADYGVEADSVVWEVLVGVGVSGGGDVCYFLAVDGPGAIENGVYRAGFDFDYDNSVLVAGDDVDFLVVVAVIAFKDDVALFYEVVAGEIFADFTEILVVCGAWGCRHFLAFGCYSSIRKVVPTPISDCLTNILPWWYSSMIRLASDSPRPQPLFLVVKPGLKMLLKLIFSIPLPESLISMTMASSEFSMFTVILPSPFMASTAFLQRFSMTH